MNNKAIDLANELAYQSATGQRTKGACSKPGCTGRARGSAHCRMCITDALAKEVGETKAASLNYLYGRLMRVQDERDTLIGAFE